MAFHGTFEHTLDAKNRLTVPAKFRTALAEGVHLISRPRDTCVLVYPIAKYNAMAQTAVAGLDPLSDAGRKAARDLFGFADDVYLDGAGRVMLTQRHLERMGVDSREVVIVGIGEGLELWSKPAWRQYELDQESDPTDAVDPAA